MVEAARRRSCHKRTQKKVVRRISKALLQTLIDD
jgi:hypothetical protein